MWKKILLAIIIIFVALSILDYILHSLILAGVYSSTPELWRPVNEMIWWVMYLASLIAVVSFVYIYVLFINPKNLKNAILYGLFIGVFMGISMGYGTYSVMPIPYVLAAAWFWGSIIEFTIAGYLLGLIIKDKVQEISEEEVKE